MNNILRRPLRGSPLLVLALLLSAAPGTRPLSLWSVVPASAQSRETPASTFRSAVDLVALDVCVKTRSGQYVPALTPDDFVILENNKPQRLQFFMPDGHVPLSVMLLLDRSASMGGEKLARAQEAAKAFVRRLQTDDQVGVMAFNEQVDERLPLTPLSRDAGTADRAEQAITGVTAEGQTGLFEAVLTGVRDLERARRNRTEEMRDVILLLSDGEDTSSRPTYEDVLEDVRRSGVLVYAISLRTDSHDRCLAPARELLQMSSDSGGRAMAVEDLKTLTPLYEEIAMELRNLYRVGYVPANGTADGAWRSISVRMTDQNIEARTRTGYYAPRPVSRVTQRAKSPTQ